MLDELKVKIGSELAKITGVSKEEAVKTLEKPREGFGDLSSKVAFLVAKEQGKNPVQVAAEIAGKIKLPKGIEKVETAGPYLNFYFSDGFYAEALEEVGEGKKKKSKKERIIVEFPSVNPNKPWHIGHLRNALLGDAVARVLEFDGFEVQRLDYIDDLGLQVAQSLYGHLILLSSPSSIYTGKFDHFVGEEYVKISEQMEKYPETQKIVRELLKTMEEGRAKFEKRAGNAKHAAFSHMSSLDIIDAWESLVEQCLKAQYQTAFDFSIYHDALIYESSIVTKIFQEGLEFLKKNKAITKETEGKNAGCWVVKLGGEFQNLTDPDKVLIRSDGTATYTGKDVVFQLWKFGKLKGDFFYSEFIMQPNGKTAYRTSAKGKKMDFGKAKKVVNVIGVEQKYPQKVIAEVLKRLGYNDEADASIHLAYEQVWLPDVKFSGRKGTWIGFTADELLKEAEKRAREKIKGEMSDSEKAKVARIVGAGAVKFSFLHPSSEKKIVFEWDRALNLEGDSGPYIQYAAVRTNGIIRKAEFKGSISKGYKFSEEEKRAVKLLIEFNEVVAKSAENLTVNNIADYALHCANAFNKFYSACPVLTAEKEEQKKARLRIVEATNEVLLSALNLIGIEAPEKM